MSEEKIVETPITKEELEKKMKDFLQLNEIEELIRSNEKIFDIDGVTYRVRKPNYKERKEAYEKKVTYFTQLLEENKYKLEMNVKKAYLKQGVDIEAMNDQILIKMRRRDDLMYQCGEGIKNNAMDQELEQYKKEIQELNVSIDRQISEKSRLLECSLENQVLIYVYSYLTYAVTEKKVNDTWSKLWPTYEEFENAERKIVNQAAYYTTLLVSSDEIN